MMPSTPPPQANPMIARWRQTGIWPPGWAWARIRYAWEACAYRLELFREEDEYEMLTAGVHVHSSAGLLFRAEAVPRCYACIGQWAMLYDLYWQEWRWVRVVDFDEDAPAFLVNTGHRVAYVLPNRLHFPFLDREKGITEP